VPLEGGNTLVLESLGRDDRFGLVESDWVEVQDDDSVLANRVDPLRRVAAGARQPDQVLPVSGAPVG